MTIHTMSQGSPEWFKIRLAKFTCSDAQSIGANGKGLETLVFEKVAEKLTGKSKEAYTNEAMEKGKELEESARSAFEIETGLSVSKVGFIEYSELIGGSPDGLIGEDGLIEIKCPTDRVFVEYLYYKKIDSKYYAQMQMQMLITGRHKCHYVLYNPNFEKSLIMVQLDRNEADIQKIQLGLTKGEELFKNILAKI